MQRLIMWVMVGIVMLLSACAGGDVATGDKTSPPALTQSEREQIAAAHVAVAEANLADVSRLLGGSGATLEESLARDKAVEFLIALARRVPCATYLPPAGSDAPRTMRQILEDLASDLQEHEKLAGRVDRVLAGLSVC